VQKLLLQSLPNLYEQVIINLTNNILTDYLSFDNVVIVVLKEENKCKNKKKNRVNNSHEVEELLISKGRSIECGSSRSQR
jgi:hypothetical protein